MKRLSSLPPFDLERYFADYEFSTPYLLSSSDCQPLTLADALAKADPESLSAWNGLSLGYTDSPGSLPLREEISSLYDGVAPGEVLIVAPQEGIFLSMLATLGPGDHVVSVMPGYQSLYEVARSVGCAVSSWIPDELLSWRFDIWKLFYLVRPETKMIVVNFPHNPTGRSVTPSEFGEIAKLAERRGILLFSDEMYRDLEQRPELRLPSAAECCYRSVTLSGMSKSLSMPGIRIGWLIVKDPAVRKRILELKDYTTICPPAPSQVLALIGLRAREHILRDNLSRNRRNLEILEAFMERRSRLFSYRPPSAGTVCLVRVNDGNASELCRRTVEEAGIMLLPSTVFAFGDCHIRIGFGRENFPEAIGRLDSYLG